jgi:hypothetical protein
MNAGSYYRLLAHGESQRYAAARDRIGQKTANSIFTETCEAIWKVLQQEYLPEPALARWQEIAKDFWRLWEFSKLRWSGGWKAHTNQGMLINFLAHGSIPFVFLFQAPPNSGSLYRNYKGTFSIVLLAAVDANYCFTLVDIGAYGRDSDGGIFANSAFGKKIYDESLGIPSKYKYIYKFQIQCPITNLMCCRYQGPSRMQRGAAACFCCR